MPRFIKNHSKLLSEPANVNAEGKVAALDKIDLKILRDLQNDGRITNVELAQNVGISAPPCLRRVRALEEMNFIRGYHAHIAPELLGFTVVIFAQVGLTSQNDADLKAFEAAIDAMPEVRECHMMAGETDFLLKIVTRDWDHYQQFLTNRLTSMKNVAHVKSSLSVKNSKYAPGVPLDELN